MLAWNCCRTCLSTQKLNPLSSSFDENEKYLYEIFTGFGIKFEPNDNLPQQMCDACIDFVKKSKQFRETVEKSLAELLRRLQIVELAVTVKNEVFDTEPDTLEAFDCGPDSRGSDDEDDMTLDNFQHKCKTDESNTEKVENSKVEDTKPIDIVLDNNKLNRTTTKAQPAKRKPRQKGQNENAKRRQQERIEKARGEVECEYCHKKLTSRLSLRNHYKIHTGFDVVCEHCGKKFITRRLLLMHCRAKHGYEKTDKCSYCDYRASNAEQVKIHERLHTGEKPFVCSDCGTGFYRKCTYLQHVAIHLPEKTVQCDQCPARFKSVTLMRIHQYKHRPKQYTYQCALCSEVFSRRRNVTRHVERVHDVTPDATHVKRQPIGKK